MAQPATMGPPLSPREPRRSGRRSAPSASASASKSPDSDAPPPRTKDPPQRPSLPSTSSGGRSKRPKQEDADDPVEDARAGTVSANSTPTMSTPGNGGANGRSKRKGKEKDKQASLADNVSESSSRKSKQPAVETDDMAADPQVAEDDEEQGITRCVCGSSEDDPDAGEFMVQCETCKVWQHGLCMGYESEDQLHDDDYYCELCRPEFHTELLKRLAKRPRQSSHHNPTISHSRTSRSHSPSYLMKQPSKRRNTMNSNFDESIKEVMEASAAEAAAHDSKSTLSNGQTNGHLDADEDTDTASHNRKKRKRTDDDANTKKRTRSASTVSDQPAAPLFPPDETPGASAPVKPPPLPLNAPPPPPKASSRQRRGGGRKAVVRETPIDGEDTTSVSSNKRQGTSSRARAGNANRRPPASQHTQGNDGGRRNQSNGTTGPNVGQSSETSRAYRNSHAYVVSQQTLFTSWNLPDYLAHLEHILPSDTPQPLEVRAGPSSAVAASGRGDSVERTMERGVKVKWPSKRMSVGDMNKRVRALVEWVGREQASALDRGRRRDALEKCLKDMPRILEAPEKESTGLNLDSELSSSKDAPLSVATETQTERSSLIHQDPPAKDTVSIGKVSPKQPIVDATSTMKMMEELMEELIGFQERFGPGAKSRERERKVTA